MTNQEILDNAPEGATHHVIENGTNFYFKIDDEEASIFTDEWDCYTNHKDVIPDLKGIRALSDIKRIVELEQKINNLNRSLNDQARLLEFYANEYQAKKLRSHHVKGESE